MQGLSWEMQGETFVAEVGVLPIGGYDVVLDMQWLSTLGPIIWDFKNLSMQFHLQDKSATLKGNTQLRMEQVSSKQMKKTLLQHAKQGFLAQLCSLVVRQEDIPDVHPDITSILHGSLMFLRIQRPYHHKDLLTTKYLLNG